ncbi:Imm63 family immunity protein [Rheinheimera faecalis]
MFGIEDISKEVRKRGSIISAPESLLVIWTKPQGDGTPYVEINNGECFYVSTERGYNIFRKKASDLDDILYLIFSRITRIMASEYELKNRVPHQDCRRVLFKKHLELLGILSDTWRIKAQQEIDKTLAANPFDDGK